MLSIEQDHTIAVFQLLLAIVIVHSSGIFGTSQVDCSEKVLCYNAAGLVASTAAEQRSQFTSVRFISVEQRVIRIYVFNLSRMEFFEQIVVTVGKVNPNGLSVSLDVEAWLSEDFWAHVFITEKTVVGKKWKVDENADDKMKTKTELEERWREHWEV